MYLVLCESNQPTRNWEEVSLAINKLGSSLKIFDSTWLVQLSNPATVKDINNVLECYLDSETEHFVVARMTLDYEISLPDIEQKWIEERQHLML